MRDRERIIGELRTRAQRGDTPAEVGTWLLGELGSVHTIQLTAYLIHAFEISFRRRLDDGMC